MCDNKIDSEAYLIEGIDHEGDRQYSKAIRSIRKAIILNPSDSKPYFNMGNALYRGGNYTQAIPAFRRATVIDPKYAKAYFNMAHAYRLNGETQTAVVIYEKLKEMTPDDCQLFLNLAYALNKNGQNDKAILNLKEALKLNQYYSKAFCLLGKQMHKRGDLEEAVANFQSAIRTDSSFNFAYYGLGKVLLEQGNIQGAIENFQTALRRNSIFNQARCYLALALYYQENIKEATLNYKRSIEYDNEFIQAYYFYGCLLLNQSKSEDAMKMYNKSIELLTTKDSNRIRLLKCVEQDIKHLQIQLEAPIDPVSLEDIKANQVAKQRIAELLKQDPNIHQEIICGENQNQPKDQKEIEREEILADVDLRSYYTFILTEFLAIVEEICSLPDEDETNKMETTFPLFCYAVAKGINQLQISLFIALMGINEVSHEYQMALMLSIKRIKHFRNHFKNLDDFQEAARVKVQKMTAARRQQLMMNNNQETDNTKFNARTEQLTETTKKLNISSKAEELAFADLKVLICTLSF